MQISLKEKTAQKTSDFIHLRCYCQYNFRLLPHKSVYDNKKNNYVHRIKVGVVSSPASHDLFVIQKIITGVTSRQRTHVDFNGTDSHNWRCRSFTVARLRLRNALRGTAKNHRRLVHYRTMFTGIFHVHLTIKCRPILHTCQWTITTNNNNA